MTQPNGSWPGPMGNGGPAGPGVPAPAAGSPWPGYGGPAAPQPGHPSLTPGEAGSPYNSLPPMGGATPAPPPPGRPGLASVLLPLLIGALVLVVGATVIVVALQRRSTPPVIPDPPTPVEVSPRETTTLPTVTTASPASTTTAPKNVPTDTPYTVTLIVKSTGPAKVRYTFGDPKRTEADSGGGEFRKEQQVKPGELVAISISANNPEQVTCQILVDGQAISTATGNDYQNCTDFTPRRR